MSDENALPGGGAPGSPPSDNAGRSLIPSGDSQPSGGDPSPTDGKPSSDGLSADPWHKGWVQADGTLNHEQLSKAPSELKDYVGKLGEFKSFDDLMKSFAHQQNLLGKKGLMPLRADASDSEREAHLQDLRAATGAPKDVEGYAPSMARPESHPEEMWDEKYASGVAEILHKFAAPSDLAKALVEHNSQWAMSELEQAKDNIKQAEDKAFDDATKQLKDAWGYRYDDEAKLATKAARHFGIDPDSEAFRTDPNVIMAMAKAGRLVNESEFVDTKDPSKTVTESAKEEAERMTTDATHPLYAALRDKAHPEYGKAAAEFDRLTRLMSQA